MFAFPFGHAKSKRITRLLQFLHHCQEAGDSCGARVAPGGRREVAGDSALLTRSEPPIPTYAGVTGGDTRHILSRDLGFHSQLCWSKNNFPLYF